VTAGRTRVALFLEQGFDDDELASVIERLTRAGMRVTLVAPLAGRPYAGQRGGTVTSERAAASVAADDVDAIVIPGGYAPDRIRMRHAMLDLVRNAMHAGKPVAAIGHGAQVLISAGALRGRTLTCWPSIAVDVKNAGGLYADRPVVEDGALITSRKTDDVPVFCDAIVRALARR